MAKSISERFDRVEAVRRKLAKAIEEAQEVVRVEFAEANRERREYLDIERGLGTNLEGYRSLEGRGIDLSGLAFNWDQVDRNGRNTGNHSSLYSIIGRLEARRLADLGETGKAVDGVLRIPR